MSNNPMLKAMTTVSDDTQTIALEHKPMSISGSINKTIILLGIVILTAFFTWSICANGFMDKAMILLIASSIAGLILAIITSFNPSSSPITAPAYAICEGIVVGAISFSYGKAFDGIVQNALAITILTLFAMLFLYKSKIIQASETFRKVIVTSTIAVAIFYFAGFIGALLGHPMTIFNGGAIGIGVSLLICGIAAFNFILDFDIIERGERNLLPKYFEWYGAFSLLVTLVWLYLEVLRLLAQFARRD